MPEKGNIFEEPMVCEDFGIEIEKIVAVPKSGLPIVGPVAIYVEASQGGTLTYGSDKIMEITHGDFVYLNKGEAGVLEPIRNSPLGLRVALIKKYKQ